MKNRALPIRLFAGLAAASLLGSACTSTSAQETARVSTAAPAPDALPQRPNIIFILVDDLPIDDFGADNPTLHTPNLDRLIHEGMYIPRAAVTTSLCSPSRATILTGMSTRNHGIVDNQHSDETGLTFFPSYLQQAGYQTAFFGKWHMGVDSDDPRPGFDHWVSFAGQGSYLPMGDFGQNRRQVLNVDGQHVDRTDYITDELTQYQMDWLEHGRDPSRPFFLYMSHKAVHGPCVPAERYAHQYDGVNTMELPASFAFTPENIEGKPMWVVNQRNSWHGIDIRHASGPQSLINERRDCDAVLSAVDDSVGETLDWLERTGLDRNTIIVFFSDNGSMWGAHGLVDKRNAYEESVRVPMIAWGPGIQHGVRSNARIRNLDLAPTFLALAGVQDRPAQFEGDNVVPLLTGQSTWADWPQDDFVYEYYWEWAYPMTPTTFSIVSGDYKLIWYHGIWDRNELYNLADDPHEMHNLIEAPELAEVRERLRHELFERLRSNSGDHRVPYSEVENRGFVFRNAQGTPPSAFPQEFELQPPEEGDFQFFPLQQRSMEQ
ncbi:MAG: sulfatase [Erythrobacter sp.]|nr:sulfatase [Erythrobacter sp.]